MVQPLRSKRLLLRELDEKDWLDIHKYASNPAVCQYQPWGPNTEEVSIRFVKEAMIDARKARRTRFAFAIIEREYYRLIGTGELNIRDTDNRIGEISYVLHPDEWGKGFATEAAKCLIDYGFKRYKLHRIYATCDSRNIASSKVLEKNGMVMEGRMREDLLLRDGWRDSLLYSVLERDWKQPSDENSLN